MSALSHPLRKSVDVTEECGGKVRQKVEFHGGGTGGEEEKSQSGTQGEESRAGIFRAKKTEKNSEDDEKGENSGADFEPEAGGIGVAGNEFSKKIQGDRGEGEDSGHRDRIRSGGRGVNSAERSRGRRASSLPEYRGAETQGGFERGSPPAKEFFESSREGRPEWFEPD